VDSPPITEEDGKGIESGRPWGWIVPRNIGGMDSLRGPDFPISLSFPYLRGRAISFPFRFQREPLAIVLKRSSLPIRKLFQHRSNLLYLE